MRQTWLPTGCFFLAVAWFTTTGQVWAEEPVDVAFFEKHIRPVLIEKCYECHSVATETSGGLALDSRPGWQRGGDSGLAIVPGKPAASRLLMALQYSDSELKMPPDGQLASETISHFERWIAAGAVDPRDSEPTAKPKQVGLAVERAQEHWAYRPISDASVPAPSTSLALDTAIDAFLNQQLERAGVDTSEPASDRAILRRLTFDLHGLPPTPAELAAYETDNSTDKYARLVDRLLASPKFGERMARRWMDVARYAESVTLRGFVLPQAWRYRDYLIAAFNEDRPLDQFVREQIAGDLMDSSDLNRRSEQLVATTFLAMGNTNLEEQDKQQLEMDYIDEQLDVIGRVFMAQTLGCARCHDHKFDPIPTRDYYALAGIFRAAKAMEHENVSKWIERPLPMQAAETARFVSLEKQLAEIKQAESQLEKIANKKGNTNKKGSVSPGSLPGIVIDDAAAQKVGMWKESSTIGPFVGAGYIHDLHESATPKSVTFEPMRLTPGVYQVRLSYTASANRTSKALVRVFSADGEKAITINQQEEPSIDRLWVSLGEFRFEQDGQAFVLLTNEGADGHVVADAVQFLPKEEDSVTQPNAATARPSATSQTADNLPAENQSAADKRREMELKRLKADRTRLEAELSVRPKALSIEEQLPAKDIPIHIRGNVHNLGPVVPRGFLSCAQFAESPKLDENRSGRLELAEWLTDPRHPLVTRVLANRLWLWTFGTGLVRTVDNFGTTGEAPSHPELLDHLATQFAQRGWSSKDMIRNLVMSAAYRRSVEATERAGELDPENRLLSHAVRKRLEVEALRDSMLAISGELTSPGPISTLKSGTKEDYRYQFAANLRAVYQPVLRNSLPELYEVFDFPNSSISIGQRSQSVVAPQALAMMNNPWVHQRAAAAANRVLSELAIDKGLAQEELAWDDLVAELFLRCLGRRPNQVESYTTRSLIDELQEQRHSRQEILVRIAHGLFASIDFRYLD